MSINAYSYAIRSMKALQLLMSRFHFFYSNRHWLSMRMYFDRLQNMTVQDSYISLLNYLRGITKTGYIASPSGMAICQGRSVHLWNLPVWWERLQDQFVGYKCVASV